MAKSPPIPDAEAGPGSEPAPKVDAAKIAVDPGTHREKNLAQQGRQGNMAQNLTHQGMSRPRGG